MFNSNKNMFPTDVSTPTRRREDDPNADVSKTKAVCLRSSGQSDISVHANRSLSSRFCVFSAVVIFACRPTPTFPQTNARHRLKMTASAPGRCDAVKMYSRCERLCVLVKGEKKRRREKTAGARDEKGGGETDSGKVES